MINWNENDSQKIVLPSEMIFNRFFARLQHNLPARTHTHTHIHAHLLTNSSHTETLNNLLQP